MRIIAFPKSGISYNDCFYQAIENQGVEVLEGVFSGGWLAGNIVSGDWIHIHWPSFFYSGKYGRIQQVIWFLRFLALLALIRSKGGRVIWTAHNLFPHDRAVVPQLDFIGRHVIIKISKIILIHGHEAAQLFVSSFPSSRKKITIIPHGHWINYYPMDLSKDAAREQLNIPKLSFVYLFIGLCKPYKNVDILIKSFRDQEDNNSLLIIAGKFQDLNYRNEISSLASADPRIIIHEGYIPNEKMQVYLKACDTVVVPYREILTSGTAMLAMSFGRPLISVSMGFLRDVVNQNIGILFSPDDPQGLTHALNACRYASFEEHAILDHARQFTFEDAANLCVTAMKQTNA